LIFDYNDWGVSVMEDEGHLGDHTSGLASTDGKWHHIAVTWRSSDGATTLYDNGREVWSVTRGRGRSIPPEGTLVVGREQDCEGGCFDSAAGAAGDVSPPSKREYGAQDFFGRAASFEFYALNSAARVRMLPQRCLLTPRERVPAPPRALGDHSTPCPALPPGAGLIDELRVWRRVRTPDEIAAGMAANLHAKGRTGRRGANPGVDPKHPDLVAYWNFDEGRGYTVRDITGHGHDLLATQPLRWEVVRWLAVCGNGVVEGAPPCASHFCLAPCRVPAARPGLGPHCHAARAVVPVTLSPPPPRRRAPLALQVWRSATTATPGAGRAARPSAGWRRGGPAPPQAPQGAGKPGTTRQCPCPPAVAAMPLRLPRALAHPVAAAALESR
jgi:hypothetical protein